LVQKRKTRLYFFFGAAGAAAAGVAGAAGIGATRCSVMPACGYSVTRCVRQHIRLYPSASSSPSITGALPGSIAAYSGRQSCCAANRSRKRLITVRTSARSWLIKAPHVKHVNSAGCLAGATPVKRGRSIYITLQSIVAGATINCSWRHNCSWL